ncbi:MAG: leucine-rich repeat protein [Bacteroides sp.]|nr:leucine-rich repeat protein [Bacteroides sp.]MBD5307563.1 leucine-rich repeat protein [Bacteroides sp.]
MNGKCRTEHGNIAINKKGKELAIYFSKSANLVSVCLLMAMMAGLTARAQSIAYGDLLFSPIDENSVSLIGYNKGVTEIHIPDFVDYEGKQYAVTEISSNLCYNDENLLSVELPSTLKIVRSGAFNQCFNLTDINLPSGVTKIEKSAFRYCRYISDVKLPEELTYLGEEAFSCCYKMMIPDIPGKVTYIGKWCFYSCTPNPNLSFLDGESPLVLEEDCFEYAYFYATYIGRNLEWPASATPKSIIGDHVVFGKYVDDLLWFEPSEYSDLCQIVSNTAVVPNIGRFTEDQLNDMLVLVPNDMLSSYEGDRNWGFLKNLGGMGLPYDEYEVTAEPAEMVINVGEVGSVGAYTDFDCVSYLGMNVDAKDIVEMPAFGEVLGLKQGTANLTITLYINNKQSVCHITVLQPATSVMLNKTSLELTKGEEATLMASVMPIDVSDDTIVWSSDDESVALVDQEGRVTAVGGGSCMIRATAHNGVAGICQVHVSVPVESIWLTPDQIEAKEGSKVKLTIGYLPSDATDRGVDWSTSDARVATISSAGYVTIVSAGSATIRANLRSDDSITASCQVIGTSSVTEIKKLCDTDASLYSLDGKLLKEHLSLEDVDNLEKGTYIIKSSFGTQILVVP